MTAIIAAVLFGLALLFQLLNISLSVITATVLITAGLLCVALHLAGVGTGVRVRGYTRRRSAGRQVGRRGRCSRKPQTGSRKVGSVQAATVTRRPVFARGPAVVLAVLAYVGVLHFAYVRDIAPIFTYLQYGYRAPDPYYYAAAIAMVIALALLLPRHIERPSHLIVWVLYLIAVLPGVIVPQISPALTQAGAFRLALWVAGCFLPVALFGTRQALRGFIPLAPLPARRWWLLVGGLWLVLNVFVIAYAGIKLTLPSFEDVYGVRGDFRVTESSDPALAYVVPLLDKVLNPLLIIRGLWFRRWAWAAAGTLGQIFLYSQQGSKTAILAPVAIVTRLPVAASQASGRPSVLAAALVGAIGVLLVDWWNASNTLTSDFVRRVLVTPGIVLSGYVQVFQDIPKAKLGYSVLRTGSSPIRTRRSRRTWSARSSSATRSPTPTPAGSPTATPTSATPG